MSAAVVVSTALLVGVGVRVWLSGHERRLLHGGDWRECLPAAVLSSTGNGWYRAPLSTTQQQYSPMWLTTFQNLTMQLRDVYQEINWTFIEGIFIAFRCPKSPVIKPFSVEAFGYFWQLHPLSILSCCVIHHLSNHPSNPSRIKYPLMNKPYEYQQHRTPLKENIFSCNRIEKITELSRRNYLWWKDAADVREHLLMSIYSSSIYLHFAWSS